MIVGVAQIVLNVADLDGSSRPYLAGGWQETFRVEAISNHPAKAGLQAMPRTELDMVHLTPPEAGTAVEFTRYRGAAPSGETVYALDGHVRVRAADPERSLAFWHALGFSERSDGLLEARAMLPAWRLAVELERTDRAPAGSAYDHGIAVTVHAVVDGTHRYADGGRRHRGGPQRRARRAAPGAPEGAGR